MKTVLTFFSHWFTRWRKQEALDAELNSQTNESQPTDLSVPVKPVVPTEVTQHSIYLYPQLHSYSCTAAILQAASAYLGLELTHARAIRLTRCKPDGASLEQVAKVLKGLHHCPTRRIARAKTVRKALRNGAVVLAGDCLTYSADHAILIFGCTDDYFLILDPAASSCEWKPDSWVFKAGNEFIAVRPRSSKRRVR
jgi:hypothetical protein